jgi:hypothetical protein
MSEAKKATLSLPEIEVHVRRVLKQDVQAAINAFRQEIFDAVRDRLAKTASDTARETVNKEQGNFKKYYEETRAEVRDQFEKNQFVVDANALQQLIADFVANEVDKALQSKGYVSTTVPSAEERKARTEKLWPAENKPEGQD